MKLLLDLSLPPRLADAVADLFPGSIHVRDAGLARAEDADLWLHARAGGYAIVSKAGDFCQRALLLGHPPKVVWLQGDCTTGRMLDALRDAAVPLRAFASDPDRCLMRIAPGEQGGSRTKARKTRRKSSSTAARS